MDPIAILFVCAGNICRSPLGEGIFRHLVENAGRGAGFDIDSAGTGGWHQGDRPDRRSIAVAAEHGIDLSAQRARRVTAADFDRFDLILGMDHDNVRNLLAAAPSAAHGRIHLFSRFTSGTDDPVPDPYYGDKRDFEAVYTMLFSGCRLLLEKAGTL
jgi:protein-tyrosine phosphatase